MGNHHDNHGHSNEQKPVSFTVPFILATVTLIAILLLVSIGDPKKGCHGQCNEKECSKECMEKCEKGGHHGAAHEEHATTNEHEAKTEEHTAVVDSAATVHTVPADTVKKAEEHAHH